MNLSELAIHSKNESESTGQDPGFVTQASVFIDTKCPRLIFSQDHEDISLQSAKDGAKDDESSPEAEEETNV